MSARLSLSDVIERLTGHTRQPSCVTLTRNAKGDTQIEVKVYCDDVAITAPGMARDVAAHIYDELCERYSYGQPDDLEARLRATVTHTADSKGKR